MLFNFFGKKPIKEDSSADDPIVEEQVMQTTVRFEQDVDAIRDRLEQEYPSAHSAIEDVRKGYLTEAQLQVRFTQDEIDMIREEVEKRNEDDQHQSTLGLQ